MTPFDPSMGPLEVALAVSRAFLRIGTTYFLGGSFASSIQGEPRATNDIDFVVDLSEPQVEPLASELGRRLSSSLLCFCAPLPSERRSWRYAMS